MASRGMREPTSLVLLALSGEPLHGSGIIASVRDLSDGRVNLGAGTLYGALDRLRAGGLIETDHDETVDGRLRRYYRLTGAGRVALEDEPRRRLTVAHRATARLGIAGWAGA